jgi:hypothetical protein
MQRAGGTRRRGPPRHQSVAAFLTRCEVRPGRPALPLPVPRQRASQVCAFLRPRAAPASRAPQPHRSDRYASGRATPRRARHAAGARSGRRRRGPRRIASGARRRALRDAAAAAQRPYVAAASAAAARAARQSAPHAHSPARLGAHVSRRRACATDAHASNAFCTLIRVWSRDTAAAPHDAGDLQCNGSMLTAWPSSLALYGVSWWQLGLLDSSTVALRVAVRSYPRRFRRNAQRCVTL